MSQGISRDSVVSFRAINPTSLQIITLLGVVLVWEFILRFLFVDLQLIFPPISEIVIIAYQLVISGVIVPHFIVSAQAIVLAVLLAILIGVPLGILIGTNEFVTKGMEPLLYYFSSVPKIILYPLFLLMLGIGLESRVVIGSLSAMFPIMVNSIVASSAVRKDLVRVSRVYRASSWQLFTKVYLPSIAIYVINGLRLGMGVAIISVMLAEIFASQAGLGNIVDFYFNNLEVTAMYGTLLIVFVCAFVLNIGLLRVQNYLEQKGYGGATGNDAGELGF